jgi:hypothetical protein
VDSSVLESHLHVLSLCPRRVEDDEIGVVAFEQVGGDGAGFLDATDGTSDRLEDCLADRLADVANHSVTSERQSVPLQYGHWKSSTVTLSGISYV